MKIKKKIMIIIASVFIILGTIFPKQNDDKVEAFAITGTALAIGALATLAVGGVLIDSQANENIGSEIVDKISELGGKVSDFINIDLTTGLINVVTGALVITAMQDVLTNRVDTAHSNTNIVQASELRADPIAPGYDPEIDLVESYTYTMPINAPIPLGNKLRYTHTLLTDIDSKYAIYPHVYDGTTRLSGNSSSVKYDGIAGEQIIAEPHITQYTGYDYATHIQFEIVFDEPIVFNPDMIDIKSDVVPIAIPDKADAQLRAIPNDSTVINQRIVDTFVPDASYTFNGQSTAIRKAEKLKDITLVDGGGLILDDDIPDNSDDTGTGTDSGILAIISNIYNFIITLPTKVANAFSVLFATVVGAIESFSASIGGMFGSLMDMLGSTITNAIYSIQSAVSDIGTRISNAVSDMSSHLWTGLNNVQSAVRAVSTTISGLFSGFFDGRLLYEIKQAVNYLIEAIGLDNLWEDLGLIWSGVTDALNTGIDTVSDWLSQILEALINGAGAVISFPVDVFNALLNGVIDLYNAFDTWSRTFANSIADAVVGIVVPTDTILDRIKATFNELRAEFLLRFEFITVPIMSIRTVFSSPKSLYDLNIEILNQKVHVMPRTFESAVSYARPIFTGVIVLITIIGIYKKVTVKEVV